MATPLSKLSLLLAFTGLAATSIAISLDLSALTVALPNIAQSLNATTTQVYWAGTGFALSSAVVQPVFAALSDAFGRRPLMITALIFLAGGTIICAESGSIAALLAGRALQGIGVGGAAALSQLVTADLFPLRKRSQALGCIGLFYLVGLSVGPIMGGGFTGALSWHWVFWFCLPFIALALTLIVTFLPASKAARHPFMAARRFDWLGAGILTASLSTFLVGITWGGTQFVWKSYQTLIPLILGMFGIGLFVVVERAKKQALISLIVLYNRTTSLCFASSFLMGIIQFAIIYFLPLYFEIAKNFSTLGAGAALVPATGSSGLISLAAGGYIAHTGKYKRVLSCGWALFATGCGVLVLLEPDTSTPEWFFITLLCGVGIGILFVALSLASMAPQRTSNQALAAGLTTFFRAVGNSFGIAIANAVYQNVIKQQLLASPECHLRLHAHEIAKNADVLRSVLQHYPPGSQTHAYILTSFIHAMRAIWWTCLGIALLGLLISSFIKSYSLDRTEPAELSEITPPGGIQRLETRPVMFEMDKLDGLGPTRTPRNENGREVRLNAS